MTRLLALLGAFGLLLPTTSWAANGDACDATQFVPAGGRVKAIWCVVILDNIAGGPGASGGPIVLDMRTLSVGTNTHTTRIGLPDELRFVVGADNDATIGTVTLTHSDVSGGPANNFVAGAATTLDVDSSSPAGTTDVAIDIAGGRPIGGFINASWSNLTAVGGFDVLVIGYEVAR